MIHDFKINMRTGHSLMELIAAMISSAVLLAGLGSVMLIGRQVAYTPSAATVRTETSEVASRLTDELQYATLLLGQSPQSLEFVIADRDGDGRAERVRYAWSGTPGDPLVKTVNGGTPKNILEAIEEFQAAYVLKPETMTLNTTSDSAEAPLFSHDGVDDDTDRDIEMPTTLRSTYSPRYFPLDPPTLFAGMRRKSLSIATTPTTMQRYMYSCGLPVHPALAPPAQSWGKLRFLDRPSITAGTQPSFPVPSEAWPCIVRWRRHGWAPAVARERWSTVMPAWAAYLSLKMPGPRGRC
jgi:hypothetical protein